MPWLYYRNITTTVIQNPSAVGFQVSIDARQPINYYNLKFWVHVYSMDGNLTSVNPLGDLLTFCGKTFEDAHKYLEFMTSYERTCNLNIFDMLNDNSTLKFYELFLEDYSVKGKLIPIPILIDNVPNVKIPGKLNNDTTSIDDWLITRRFFLVDLQSGIQGDGNYKAGSKPFTIRYASKLKLVITLQNMSQPLIYPPYLEIFYNSRLVSTIDEFTTSQFSFTVDYTMDISSFMKAMLGIMITLIILMFICAIVKINVWRYTHPKIFNPDTYYFKALLNFITVFLGLVGKAMFWFMFFISMYWFIFFKLQYQIYLILPPENDSSWSLYYQPFYASLYI